MYAISEDQRGEIKWRYNWRISDPDLLSKDGIQSLSGVNPIPKQVRIWIFADKRFAICCSHCLCLPLPTSHLCIKRPWTAAGRPGIHKSCIQYPTCSMSVTNNNLHYFKPYVKLTPQKKKDLVFSFFFFKTYHRLCRFQLQIEWNYKNWAARWLLLLASASHV